MSELNSISVIAASDGVNYLLNDVSKSAISVDTVKTDLVLQHISQEDYDQLVVDDKALSNSLYIVSADYVETYGQQIKNVAEPTDLSDAVTKGYVDSNFQPAGNYLTAVPDAYKTYAATLSSLSSTYSLTSHTHNDYVPTSRTVAGQQLTANVTPATISTAIGLGGYYTKTDLTGSSGVLKDYSLTSHTHSQYLTAVPSTYKTYSDTKQSLSNDGYATQVQLDTKSAISVDNEHADANMIHISQEDYSQLVVDDEVLSNVIYVISSDYIEAYGQQMKNLAPGVDLSDAVNVEQLNMVSTLANYYMKSETSSAIEISSALSSISSTLSGLEDILHEINTGSQS